MAEYIVIENNIIKGIYCGSVLEDENTIILPINHQVQEGDRLDFYNEDFSRKSDYELIIQGLIDIPKGISWRDNFYRNDEIRENIITI